MRSETEEGIGSGGILAIIFVVILVTCGVTIYVFAKKLKQKRERELMEPTETELRYIEVAKLRKAIRYAQGDAKKIEELTEQLNSLKAKQTQEFIDTLPDTMFEEGADNKQSSCTVCLETFLNG